jgi:hypothetical protein
MQINKARLGGLRRVELYGNPGTPEGRSKGGKKTIRLFHRDKDLARKAGFIIRKFGFDAYMHGDQVFIYSISGIKKYFEEIGTHNPKHSDKITRFFVNL